MRDKDKYPCCVCTEEFCLGSNCPAEDNEQEYARRLKEKIDTEIPVIPQPE